MAKIGILTFHRSNNTGAFIQCYSLLTKLRADFPEHDVEVIDYCTDRTILNYSWKIKDYVAATNKKSQEGICQKNGRMIKNILRLVLRPHILKDRKRENDLFEADRKYLLLSKERLVSGNTDDFVKFVENKYDIIVVGSDCVWQYVNYPFPNAYLLKGEIAKIKMSYAACAYKMDLDKMSDGDIGYMRAALASFDYLGVRDVETEKMLTQLSLPFEHNCDPAFLLNMEDIPVDIRELRAKMERKGVDFSRKIIGLQVSYKYIGKWVRDLFDDREYQIVALRMRNAYAEVFLEDITPFEWSRVFSFFYCTVTDFFHGTLLSLMNHTIPIVFDTGFLDEGRESRIGDVMKRMDLSDYYYKVKDDKMPAAWLNTVMEKVTASEGKIDFDTISERESRYYQGFKKKLEEYLLKLQ